jgi:alpha-ketoglutarate-dependent taurine dioxygenase
MKLSKIPGLGRFGTYIDDVDFNHLTNDEWLEIGKIHMQGLVTVVRNTNLTKDHFVDRVLKFGETRYGLKNYLVKKYDRPWPIIVDDAQENADYLDAEDAVAIRSLFKTQERTASGYDVSRVTGGYDADGNPRGLFAEGELLWHSNESGTLTWTPGVALLAHQNVVGSATGFVTTPDYYESVNDSFRRELDDMIILHRFTPGKINPGLNKEQDAIMHANMCPEEDREIPMVIRSPGGITGLHYSINTAYSIKGLTKKESDKVFKRINKELFVEKYMYDHWYKNNNDLMLFDNSITLHRRLGNIEGRLCYRIAHDYTNLQDGAYQPYLQQPYANEYANEIRHIVKIAGIKNFKLPPRDLLGYFKAFAKKYVHA